MSCRESKSTKVVSKNRLNEINIGVMGGQADTLGNAVEINFRAFWNLNLLNDSIYLKIPPSSLNELKKPIFRAGKIRTKDTLTVNRFIKAALAAEKGQRYLFESDDLVLYCFPLHVVEYKNDTVSKYFFVNAENGIFRETIDLVRGKKLDTTVQKMPSKILEKENKLLNILNTTANLENLPFVPDPVPQKIPTIIFTPGEKK